MEILDKVPKKNRNLAWRIIDAEAVIVPLGHQPREGERLNILNETATRVWQLCNGKNTVGKIIQNLKEEYAADSGVIDAQVKKTINELLSQELIHI